MEQQKIKTTLFRMLIIILLAGMVQDAPAQRTVLNNEQRSDQKRTERKVLKSNKEEKQSGKKAVQHNRTIKSVRTETMYSKNEQRKKDYRGSGEVQRDRTLRSERPKAGYSKNEGRKRDRQEYNKDYQPDKRDKEHTYKHPGKKSHYPTIKTWSHRHYRKPAWVDYHRPGYRYPRIGMHVSVLPHGFFSFVIGKFRFYTYRGIYYRYEPVLRVYVVVKKPVIETCYTAPTWDCITLVDGSTIEGVYRYTENDMVIFEVGDALLEIPMREIRILSLSGN